MKKIVISCLALVLSACAYFSHNIEMEPQTLPNAKLNEPYMAEVRFVDSRPLVCHLNITADAGLQIIQTEYYKEPTPKNKNYKHHCTRGFIVYGTPNKIGEITVSASGGSYGTGGPMALFVPKYEFSYLTTIKIEP